jgi:membrane associated rhomboid family serine protease
MGRAPLRVKDRRVPVATVVVVAGTAAVSLLGLLQPHVVTALERNSAELRAGHWWRLLTPLLVQSDGWGQFAVNMVGTALFGTLVERTWGTMTFLASYLAGGLVGQALGYLWEPPGGGSSVAMVGVLGAATLLIAWPGRQASRAERLIVALGLCLLLALLGLRLDSRGHLIEGLLVAMGSVVATLQVRLGRPLLAGRLLVSLVLLTAVALSLLRDHHGTALLAGLVAALPVILWTSRHGAAWSAGLPRQAP